MATNRQTWKENFSRQPFTDIFNVGVILQSFWIRCRSVFPNITDRKFMESELRFVLYCGSIFWAVISTFEDYLKKIKEL
jgi:hypothetical protein